MAGGEETSLLRTISPGEFEQIRDLAYRQFGLDLRAGKEALVAARLNRQLRELGFHTFREYYQHVSEDRSGESLVALIDALTTNHTSFFREAAHFDVLRDSVLPRLAARAKAEIWCAACASGEEAYSLAFVVLDHSPALRQKLHILATDISTRMLAAAGAAVYPTDRVETLPEAQLRRYFLKGANAWRGCYRVRPEIRRLIEFRRLNLVNFKPPGLFPVIFCRNVMIYFDKPTQGKVVAGLTECLEPGGYLFLGHAETLTGITHGLRYVRPAVYQKPEGVER